jgi:hypothetical protein
MYINCKGKKLEENHDYYNQIILSIKSSLLNLLSYESAYVCPKLNYFMQFKQALISVVLAYGFMARHLIADLM